MNEPCQLAIQRVTDGYLIRVTGRGTMRESPTLRDFVCGALEDGASILLDLNGCDYLDSTCLGCLVMLHQRQENLAGAFRVLADEAVRQKLLAGAQLHRLLTFADECPESISEPVVLPVAVPDRQEFGQHLLDAHRRLAELGGPTAKTFHGIADQLEADLARQSQTASEP